MKIPFQILITQVLGVLFCAALFTLGALVLEGGWRGFPSPDAIERDALLVIVGAFALCSLPYPLGLAMSYAKPNWNIGILIALLVPYALVFAFALWGMQVENGKEVSDVGGEVFVPFLIMIAMSAVLFPSMFWRFRKRNEHSSGGPVSESQLSMCSDGRL